METNNIINIPEGYEIDKDKSNERQIVPENPHPDYSHQKQF